MSDYRLSQANAVSKMNGSSDTKTPFLIGVGGGTASGKVSQKWLNYSTVICNYVNSFPYYSLWLNLSVKIAKSALLHILEYSL